MKKIYTPLIVMLFACSIIKAQDGTPDNSFGTSGIATTQFSNASSDAYAIGRQLDGKIVIAGISAFGGTNICVARFNTNGTLDNTFGSNGQFKYNYGSASGISALAIQTDGKIVLGGASAVDKAMLVRLTANGQLDNTFGTGGIAEFQDGFSRVLDLRVIAGGKILGMGKAVNASNKPVFGVFRRNADGSKDSAFGTSGYLLADAGDNVTPTKMALQPDGKILVTGTTFLNSTKYDMVITRFTANGAWDTSFGTGGKTITAFSTGNAYEQGNDLLVQPDGKIVIAGRNSNNNVNSFLICRYKADGTVDTGFGTNGITVTPVASGSNDEIKSVTLMADGKIVVCGNSVTTARKIALARYKADGKIDNTFGTNGIVTTTIANGSSAEEVLIQPDGKIVIGGWSQGSNGLRSFVVARYNNTGTSGLPIVQAASIGAKVFPNPIANGTATLTYQLTESQTVATRLLSVEGRHIASFFNEKQTAGEQNQTLEIPVGLPTGLYFLQITTEKGVATMPIEIQ